MGKVLGQLLILEVVKKLENKTAFISGNFSVLHVGHVRLFKFAKSISTELVVGVYADEILDEQSSASADERALALLTNRFIDQVVIIDRDVNTTLFSLKPDIVIKGTEYKDQKNEEKKYIDATSAQLIFSSGATINFTNTSQNYSGNFKNPYSGWFVPKNFIDRHKLSYEKTSELLEAIDRIKLLVIGDTIVDRYVDCTAVGMSQEEPIIVASPIQNNKFVGGAAIVSAHARSLGSAIKLITLLGDDPEGKYIKTQLNDLGVALSAYHEIGRPTTTKTRYKISGKSVFRLNELLSDDCSQEIQDSIYEEVKLALSDVNMVIFSDFNYGILPKRLIDRITELCVKSSVPTIADSQSSSQLGDITRYKNSKLVTPTEFEARVSLHNKEDGLVQLAEQIRLRTNSEHVFLKIGKAGLIIHNSHGITANTPYRTDELPALNNYPTDTAGAGDSLMITSSLMLSKGASIWEAALIGSIAAGIQVSRTGNIPVTIDEIKPALWYIFNQTSQID